MEAEIQAKLNALAEYHAQKSLIDTHKREALNELRVPEDVKRVISRSRTLTDLVDTKLREQTEAITEEARQEYSKIVIPDEIKALLNEIDRQREQVQEKCKIRIDSAYEKANAEKRRIEAETDTQVKDVFDQLNQRKSDIEAEFAEKAYAVDQNIEKLKDQIEADVLAHGKTVTGKYFQAVWNKGRVGTWNSGKLDGLALILPQIAECRNPGGDPTVYIKAVK